MDAITKKLLAGAAICAVSIKVLFFLIDSFAPPTHSGEFAEQKPPLKRASVGPSREQVGAILHGADPTDVLKPTEAGRPQNGVVCRKGKLEMEKGVRPDLNGRFYVSSKIGGRSYILVMTLEQGYLVQRDYQVVTASERKSIPDVAEQKLKQALRHLSGCDDRILYLSSVTPANSQ